MRTTIALGFLVAAFAATHAGSASATVSRAVVPDDFPTVQEALDALTKTGSSNLHIKPGTYAGPVMATGFLNLAIDADAGATIVGTGSEPALTVCGSAIVQVTGLAIASDSVGLFVNGVGRVTAIRLDVTAGSHGVLAESSMSIAEIKAMFGLGYHVEGFPTLTSTEIDLASSTVTSQHGDAVRVGAGEAAQLVAVTLVAPQGDGVHAEGTGGTIAVREITIADAGDDGVDVAGRALQVVTSSIVRPADDGVTVGAGGKGSVADTRIEDAGDVGIESHDGGWYESITDCTVTGAGADAIHISGLRVMRCTVTHASGDGIFVAGPVGGTSSVAGISSNVVERVGGNGIVSGVPGLSISLNQVTDAGGDGIVAGADLSRTNWNTVSHTGGDGIQASGDRVQVVDNDVTSAQGDGLQVSGIDVYVADNSVALTGEDGIRVAGEGAYVSHNDVASPAGDGIVVARGWSEVIGDTVSGAGGDGICVLGAPDRSGAPIRDNVIEGAAGDGIDLGAATGTRVAGNTIASCGDCGIRLGDGAKRNRLAGNRAQDSGSYDLYESEHSRRNRIAQNNRFRTRHRAGR